jgi:hypothetical protein
MNCVDSDTSIRDFDALVRRAGLSLSSAHLAQIRDVWSLIEPLLERVRAGADDRFSEPAQTFVARTCASSESEMRRRK